MENEIVTFVINGSVKLTVQIGVNPGKKHLSVALCSVFDLKFNRTHLTHVIPQLKTPLVYLFVKLNQDAKYVLTVERKDYTNSALFEKRNM